MKIRVHVLRLPPIYRLPNLTRYERALRRLLRILYV